MNFNPFKPFKVTFRAYRNVLKLKNQGGKCQKKDLTQWASLTFQKALTKKNIFSGSRATRIWPLNPKAMIARTSPSEAFKAEFSEEQERDGIFEAKLSISNNGSIHYYGSQEGGRKKRGMN